MKKGRKPFGGRGAAIVGEKIFAAPDGDGERGGAGSGGRFARDENGAVALGGKGERVGRERGGDLSHARKRALGKELALEIDDEKTTVADEPEFIDLGGFDCDAPERFDGVDVESGEVHGAAAERRFWRTALPHVRRR